MLRQLLAALIATQRETQPAGPALDKLLAEVLAGFQPHQSVVPAGAPILLRDPGHVELRFYQEIEFSRDVSDPI